MTVLRERRMSERGKDSEEEQHERGKSGWGPESRESRHVLVKKRVDEAVGTEGEFECCHEADGVDEDAS